MRMTLELIHILDAIDRNGSFEKAAQELHKVTSALTYTIRKFETRLGVDIFDRSKQRAKLTPAGVTLLEQGRHLLQLSAQLEQQIRLVGSGWESTLKIVYDEIINHHVLFELIADFKQTCPTMNIDLYSEILGGCADALQSGRADFAIATSKSLPNRSDFIFQELGLINFQFAVAPSHPLAKEKEPLSTSLIKRYPMIVARDTSRQLPPISSSSYLPEQHRITVSTMALKKEAQMQGLGVGFLPANHIKQEVKTRRLIVKKVERQLPDAQCYLVWNRHSTGKAQEWFIKQLSKSNVTFKVCK